MNVGIIGSGRVGRALGAGFATRGHTVRLGTRDPEQDALHTWLQETDGNVAVGSNSEAAAFGDLLVVATAWEGTENALGLAGPEQFRGKPVIDATNPLDFSDGTPRLAVIGDDSSGEQMMRWLPGAHVVKAFNTVGASLMVDPDLPGGPPTMFIAGDDDAAKSTVTDVIGAFGWEAIDLGGIETSRYLDALAMVWIVHAIRTGSRSHAFKLLAP